MWGFWIMAPPCAAALPGTGGVSKAEGHTQLHKEGIGVMKGEGNVNRNQWSGGAVAIWKEEKKRWRQRGNRRKEGERDATVVAR